LVVRQFPSDIRSEENTERFLDSWVVWCFKVIREVASETSAGVYCQARQLIGNFLLVGIFAPFHATFFKSVVIIEEQEEQVPQDAALVEMRLKPEVDRKGSNALTHNSAQLGKILYMQKN
jgi:hypothetical protein